jgi:hypothetical protein
MMRACLIVWKLFLFDKTNSIIFYRSICCNEQFVQVCLSNWSWFNCLNKKILFCFLIWLFLFTKASLTLLIDVLQKQSWLHLLMIILLIGFNETFWCTNFSHCSWSCGLTCFNWRICPYLVMRAWLLVWKLIFFNKTNSIIFYRLICCNEQFVYQIEVDSIVWIKKSSSILPFGFVKTIHWLCWFIKTS